VPGGTGPALADALADPDAGVRAAAGAGLRELVEVLEPSPALTGPLVAALASPDPAARAAAAEVLRVLRLAGPDLFARALDDADPRVRVEAVRGLLALDAADQCAAVPRDPSREVRVALAKGLAPVGAGRGLLAELAADADPLVRAAALEALGGGGPLAADLEALVLAALGDPQWRVRKGAAAALAACPSGVPALLAAARDPHPDVRRAAVDSLAARVNAADDPDGADASGPGVRAALREALLEATADPDADVRAYARLALAAAPAR
jgi:HEAT repeat protein